MPLTFDDFTNVVPAAGDFLVGYALAGGAGSDRRYARSTLANPPTNDGMTLGTPALQWSDFYLADGGNIVWNNAVYLGAAGNNIFAQASAAGSAFVWTVTDSGNVGPIFQFVHNSVSPANSDTIGIINFNANNSAAAQKTYAQLFTTITDVTSTSEDSSFTIALQKAGAQTNILTLDPVNGIRMFETAATPSNGLANQGIKFGSAGVGIYWGSGAPTFTAVQGSIYINVAGGINSRLYQNTTGSTTWTAFTSAA